MSFVPVGKGGKFLAAPLVFSGVTTRKAALRVTLLVQGGYSRCVQVDPAWSVVRREQIGHS